MYTFLWSGKDADGREGGERVEAENAQEAKKILQDRGWTDLELIKEEITNSEALRMEEQITPDKEVKLFRGGKGLGLPDQTWTGIKQSVGAILLIAALLGWGIYRQRTWLIIVASLGLAFLFLLRPVLYLMGSLFGSNRREYARLNRATVWARWEEVLKCVERLRRTDRFTGATIPEFELVRSRAMALAALGRLDQGLAEFRQYENSPKVEHWLYVVMLAGIYDAGREFEKGLECRREAAAEKPDTSAVWVDLAYSLVRRLNHPVEARQALEQAEKLEIVGFMKIYLNFLRGMILFREHKFAEAKPELEQSITGQQALTINPLAEGVVLFSKSYLCAVQGELGNTSEAKKLFREVEPFLIAHREDELLQACRSAALVRS